jgi:hypothetical protein
MGQPCALPEASGEMVLVGFASSHDDRLAALGECHDM